MRIQLAVSVASLALAIWAIPKWSLRSTVLNSKMENGVIHVATGQSIQPAGSLTEVPGRPVDIALEPSRGWLAILNSNSVVIVDAEHRTVLSQAPLTAASYTGIAFRPESSELWVSEIWRTRAANTAQENDSLAVFSIDPQGKLTRAARLRFSGKAIPAGIAFSRDGRRAFVALNGANAVAEIDTAARRVVREFPVGVAPFGVAVLDAGQRVIVTNRGASPKPGTAAAFSAGSPVSVDARTGAVLPGSLSAIDTTFGKVRSLPAGLAPTTIASSPDGTTLAFANTHEDTVTILNGSTLASTTLPVPQFPSGKAGALPTSVAFSPDGRELYVTCAGTNALIRFARQRQRWVLEGALPTAWFPAALVVDARTGIHIVNTKGVGNTLRAGGNFTSTSYHGSLQTIVPPSTAALRSGSAAVQQLNLPRFSPDAANTSLARLGIKHVVLIIKENRTYDQILGDLPQGNGDPNLVMYGRLITPNTHALAEQYVLLDNFYTSGAISFDGHHWLMMAFASDHTERAFPASPRGYAWNMADPLVVAPTGFFWQGPGKSKDVRLYGEFCEDPDQLLRPAGSAAEMPQRFGPLWADNFALYRSGYAPSVDFCQAAVPSLAGLVDRRYPVSLDIPDQFKADEFLREFSGFEQSRHLPALSVLMLNNDHTQGTRPGKGTPRAMVADNDLALGRIVDRISKSSFWDSTLILVTEDDAQDGIDHVDGRRTVCLAIGPRVRRNAIISDNYDHLSLVRTIQDILGVTPQTRFAAAARPMAALFADSPDSRPFTHLPARINLTEANPPLAALKGTRRWAAEQSQKLDFDGVDQAPPNLLNRILWADHHAQQSGTTRRNPHPQSQ